MLDIGTLNIKEQFELGRQTSCLVTPLGANSNFFLNLPTGANVIELAPPMDSMNVTGPFGWRRTISNDRWRRQHTGNIKN